MPSDQKDPRILIGTAHPEFGKKICEHLGVTPIKAIIGRHPDGEIKLAINESLREQKVFVIQPTCPDVNKNVMELAIILDALKRASVKGIRIVMPYFGYARQERKTKPREPISAKLVADVIGIAGGKKLEGIVTVELHAGAIQGFFNVPVDHIFSDLAFIEYINASIEIDKKNLVIVSPDVGGTERARRIAKGLGVPLAVIEKRRNSKTGEPEALHIIGDVKGKDALLYDDIIGKGGTLIKAAKRLLDEDRGAKRVWACGIHAVFADEAIQRLESSPIEKIIVTDTLPMKKEESASSKIERISVTEMSADIIRRIHKGKSVSEAFPSN